jgi:hypothetical protein
LPDLRSTLHIGTIATQRTNSFGSQPELLAEPDAYPLVFETGVTR